MAQELLLLLQLPAPGYLGHLVRLTREKSGERGLIFQGLARLKKVTSCCSLQPRQSRVRGRPMRRPSAAAAVPSASGPQ